MGIPCPGRGIWAGSGFADPWFQAGKSPCEKPLIGGFGGGRGGGDEVVGVNGERRERLDLHMVILELLSIELTSIDLMLESWWKTVRV